MLNVMEIERFATKDGPGIRTVVFLKGCPLHCPWCANPESQRVESQMLNFRNKCVGCGMCVDVCPNGARTLADGKSVWNAEKCTLCGACVTACARKAMQISGQEMSIQEILAEVQKDKDYYIASGGGLTVSGGEPLRQAAGVAALFWQAHEKGISTAVETCGVFATSSLDLLHGLADLFLFDIKSGNAEKLKEVTGADLALIRTNLRRAVESGAEVIARVPVIPGFNHEELSMREIMELARECGVTQMDLLPYHTLGKNKYAALGREYPMGDVSMLKKSELEPWKALAEEYGITAHI